jgi:ATP-dependent DNA ligase
MAEWKAGEASTTAKHWRRNGNAAAAPRASWTWAVATSAPTRRDAGPRRPYLATLVAKPPKGDDWAFEVKWDA